LTALLTALSRAFVSLFHPRMLMLMVWPVVAALLLWIGLTVAFWSQAVPWIDLQLRQYDVLQWMVTTWPLSVIGSWLIWLLLLVVLIPLVLLTAVLIIGLFGMPVMVRHVADRYYPELERRHGGTFIGSVWNAVAALFWFVLLAVASLPLWLIPVLWPVIGILLFGYFNQRVFRYDALAEHASPPEMEALIRRHKSDFMLLGIALAVFGHVPLVGLLMPVYGGLAFIYFALDRLAELRAEQRAPSVELLEGNA
jgi:CysZ protein